MKKIIETELGHYLSSFFFMKINTNEELVDFSKLKIETESTFVHEYVHFFQDISTTYGLLTFAHIIDMIISMTKNIHLEGEDSFHVPIVLNDDTAVGKAIDILSVIKGDDKLSYDIGSIKNIDLVKEELIADIELFHCDLTCITTTNIECHLLFGSLCIIEGMAYHIENLLYDNIHPPEFPYKICDIIIKYKYPLLLDNELNIIALCDIALNSINPGRFFIESLDHMRENKFIPKNPKEIYDFLLKYGYKKENGEFISIKDLYPQLHSKALKQIDFLFYDPILTPIKEWTINLLNKAFEKRTNEFAFLLNVFTGDKAQSKLKFFELVNTVGVPLMSNKDDSFCFPSQSIQVFNQMPIYRAIYELFNILSDKQKDCKLINLCKPTGIVTEDCYSQPWKWSSKDKKCTFGLVWALYGLKGKVPLFNY
jgi:hypothetical protein